MRFTVVWCRSSVCAGVCGMSSGQLHSPKMLGATCLLRVKVRMSVSDARALQEWQHLGCQVRF